MKKSVTVNGQKIQVEFSQKESKDLIREVRKGRKLNDDDVLYLLQERTYSINGTEVKVVYESIYTNGNDNRKWQLNGIWHTSEKKFIEAFLNN
jgi:hypothetical protein